LERGVLSLNFSVLKIGALFAPWRSKKRSGF